MKNKKIIGIILILVGVSLIGWETWDYVHYLQLVNQFKDQHNISWVLMAQDYMKIGFGVISVVVGVVLLNLKKGSSKF
ncbi:MAG: hypothetical protein WA131_11410 [Desulfitobacteriaceae bacterium]